MITGKQLVEQAKKHLGEPYVYGCKHELLTLDKYNYLQKTYGKRCVWDSDKNKVGKVCCDCSGLIGISLQELGVKGWLIGSSQFKAKAKTVKPISDIKNAPVGALVWMQGHIGIYIGDGRYIAEDGSAYGCRIASLSQNRFTHYLLLDCIDYAGTTQDTDLKEAVHRIALSGVKINEASWGSLDRINLKYVPGLLDKLGGIDHLVKQGIISQRKIWDDRAYTVNNVRSLLIKYSDIAQK